ncbi:hypothetical protein P8918_13665 [Bacillus spizizenii]|nr:hypothetical protein [Bacillus spizizenii]MCY8890352.1 hypothetical protein [Bacillus spizizenii]MEC0842076.1 hypothetical protein [Bacillus spizizenii]
MTTMKLLRRCYAIGMTITVVIAYLLASKYEPNPLAVLGFQEQTYYPMYVATGPAEKFWTMIIAGTVWTGIVFLVILAYRKLRPKK